MWFPFLFFYSKPNENKTFTKIYWLRSFISLLNYDCLASYIRVFMMTRDILNDFLSYRPKMAQKHCKNLRQQTKWSFHLKSKWPLFLRAILKNGTNHLWCRYSKNPFITSSRTLNTTRMRSPICIICRFIFQLDYAYSRNPTENNAINGACHLSLVRLCLAGLSWFFLGDMTNPHYDFPLIDDKKYITWNSNLIYFREYM